ncbi:MAG: NAD(P)/FAD-dependent oxidoreductase [Firmicutes bacterium]|jgi:phytoene dehydrogenase-like protein|nr:NAD(P)/FAD-dependent oxidoreductase [Bacillota bacterium]
MIRSIAIIGAGIGGLSAGCYARTNGYETDIFELHSGPGELCTSWRRGDYVFDGCIHWLVGTSPAGGFGQIWEELGALQGKRIVDHEELLRYEGPGGKYLALYTDADRLERHLKELAPGDLAAIEEFTGLIRRLAAMEMPIENPGLFEGLKLGLKMLPVLGAFRKYGPVSVREYAGRFSDPFLREAFAEMYGGMSGFPLLGLGFILAAMQKSDAGYPVGGSLEFARAIERRYLGLGGRVHYNARVERILVEDDRAVGVRTADGREHRADYVISAADGHSTIFGMLEGRYADDRLRGYYQGGLEPFPPMIQVSLGVARDLSVEPPTASFPLRRPIVVAGKPRLRMGYRHFCYDPTMAPAGTSVVVVTFMTDYEYWRDLHADRGAYQAEKDRVAAAVVEGLAGRFPGIEGQVEVVDVATPMTYEHYTANWRASFEGWLITAKTMGMMFRGGLPKSLPGLANFHMIGQWTVIGGGLPPAAKDRRDVIKKICLGDRRKFTTAKP